MYKSLFIFLFFLFFVQSTDPVVIPDFTDVDSYARKIKKSSTIGKTAERLTDPFNNEVDKVRAIYIWITQNVDYDVRRAMKNGGKSKRTRIVANSEYELAQIKLKREKEKAEMAFRSGKGVCENYSFLFMFMCHHVGIEAELVGGFGRNDPGLIGLLPRGSNHAWNRVKINGKWYLLDATWAAGMTDINKGTYTRKYKEGFFLTDPRDFILTHYPDDAKWQLLDKTISLKQFSELPLGHPALSTGEVLDYFPKTGMIQNSKGGITIKITVTDPESDLILLDNRRRTKVKRHVDGNTVSFIINKKQLKGHELTIARIVDHETIPIISYKVI